MAAPRSGPHVELLPLSENLAETVELSQGDDNATSETTDNTPVYSVPFTSRELSSFRSTPPSAALVLIARVHKLLYPPLDEEVYSRG